MEGLTGQIFQQTKPRKEIARKGSGPKRKSLSHAEDKAKNGNYRLLERAQECTFSSISSIKLMHGGK